MSYSSFSDNDDDLFNDAPPSSSTNFSTRTPDDIQSLLESVDGKDLSSVSSMLFRSKVALTLFDSANSYVYDSNAYNRTIFNTLNYLTNNEFQYHLYADVLEETIVRRVIIRDFLSACVNQTSDDLLRKLAQIVNVDMDKKFIVTYFESSLGIMNFAIQQNIELYTKVCAHVNREPFSFVIDNNIDSEDVMTLVSPNSYINNVFSNIKNSFGYGMNK